MEEKEAWFFAEYTKARGRVEAAFGVLEALLANSNTPSFLLREAFAEVEFYLKEILALSHFQKWHFDSVLHEGLLIGMLAQLKATPITRPSWRVRLEAMKREFAQLSSPAFDASFERDALEMPPDMFVSGPDRVSEGDREIDFNLPEASVVDQVRNEIAIMVEDIWARMPRAG